jgi:hypothetical protein
MSSMKELLVLRIDGAIEALAEPYRDSLCRLLMLGLCGSTAAGGFSVIGTEVWAEEAEEAVGPALPALPALK